MSFDAKDDLCVGFWTEVLKVRPELLHLPEGGSILEVGSADADWLSEMHRLRPDLALVGIDPRAKAEHKSLLARYPWDVLTCHFDPASFDAAVMISAVEHIGCPMYPPEVEDGDTRTMQRLGAWVKPGGWCYLDVPFRPDGVHHVKKGNFRAYSPESLRERLIVAPWREVYRQVFTPGHIDGPYMALILERV